MKKYKSYIFSIIAIALMLWLSSCASIREYQDFIDGVDPCPQYEEDGYHTSPCYDKLTTKLEPKEMCCSITIEHATQNITYNSELGIDIEHYDSLEEMDAIINAMQEHCYYEHYREY